MLINRSKINTNPNRIIIEPAILLIHSSVRNFILFLNLLINPDRVNHHINAPAITPGTISNALAYTEPVYGRDNPEKTPRYTKSETGLANASGNTER